MNWKEERLKYYRTQVDLAIKELRSANIHYYDEDKIWTILIYELECFEVPTDVIFKELSCKKIAKIIKEYDEKFGIPLTTLQIPESIILEEFFLNELEKATFKIGGEIWTVHINDLDYFPSSPHAHNYQSHLKLHLGNGLLY